MLAFFLVCNMINYSFFLNLFLPHGVLSACGSYRAVSFPLVVLTARCPFFSRGAMSVAVCRL